MLSCSLLYTLQLKTSSASLICLTMQVWIDHDRQQRTARAVLVKRHVETL